MSMNQDKLEVVKQEMARVNADILGISELKWTAMGEFNSDDHYIYYCGQECLRRIERALIIKKRVQSEILIAKFRLKVKKTTRPFRYNLKQIPYDYTVEVMNRFKGLDLRERVSEELWMEVHNTVWEAVTKTIPKKRKARRQSGCLRRLYK